MRVGRNSFETSLNKALRAGLQINGRFLKPQRLGVVDGGLGAQKITSLVVLFDRVSPEPMLDAGVIVVQSPEGLGI